MKRILIVFSFVFAMFIADSCRTSRDVEYRSRTERVEADGDVVRKDRRINDDGITIKKRKRDRDVGMGERDDDEDVDVRVRKERRVRDRDRDIDLDDDEPAVIIRREDR